MLSQRTISRPFELADIGLHSGQPVRARFWPHDVDGGIVFRRHVADQWVTVPARADLIQEAFMCSNLVLDGQRVGTVEHVLSAVAALGIDNLLIEVDAAELPIVDGSAAPIFAALHQAGVQHQPAAKRFIQICQPIHVSHQDKWARFEPYAGFALDFTIDFAHPVIQGSGQQFCFEFSTAGYAEQIAAARTFGFMDDLQQLQAQQLALGAGLHNAIGLDQQNVLNPEGLRYADEFVRHKILDAIGDLSLLGHQIIGKFSAYKSGHALNNQLLRAVIAQPECWTMVTFEDAAQCPIRYEV